MGVHVHRTLSLVRPCHRRARVPGSSSVRVCAVPATVRCSSSSRVFRLLLVTRGSAPVTLVCHDSGARSDGGRFPAGALRAPGGPLGLVPHAPQPREVSRGRCLQRVPRVVPRGEVFCSVLVRHMGWPPPRRHRGSSADATGAVGASQADANGGEYLSVGGIGRRCDVDNVCSKCPSDTPGVGGRSCSNRTCLLFVMGRVGVRSQGDTRGEYPTRAWARAARALYRRCVQGCTCLGSGLATGW
jgi:hypothetical protein